MSEDTTQPGENVRYVSRAAPKLAAALERFGIDPRGRVCADLGCNVGGFTQVLLRHGAARVYAVDTGYGVLDYSLRRDARVVVMERTNAMHARLPELCGLVVIDAGWTRQVHILRAAGGMLAPGGQICSLLKPHYEAPRAWLRRGLLEPARREEVIAATLREIEGLGLRVIGRMEAAVAGQAGNREEMLWIEPVRS
jgi:23S rRNA (cytidine1920-2'-O)/16S rRNA (cytidine1409-2'-O)-methyltransferase